VEALGRVGIKPKRVAELAGLDPRVVVHLVRGASHQGRAPSRRIRRRTERAILAVRPDPAGLKDAARVDGTGTRRRLQALIAMGWSLRKLADLCGISRTNLGIIARADGVRAGTARKVSDLYDRIWDVPPPQGSLKDHAAAVSARAWARREGWPSPLAWDDDLIDDPAARPDFGVKVTRQAALSEDCDELLRLGLTLDQVAERLGVTRSYLDKARQRAKRAAA
jgi:transcriptional regulator with XRE-family HTH domain